MQRRNARLQFHVLSFEGPDPYSRAGGIASRVCGLTETLASLNFETHLWFVGDPDAPGHEALGNLHLHRWCQWISHYHGEGVYDGEHGKAVDYAGSLPPVLFNEYLMPHFRRNGQAVIMAEEWQTVDAVLHLDWLLHEIGARKRATVFWNANNVFGFEQINWHRLKAAAYLTTVSRYMRHCMWAHGVDPLVFPNGLAADAFEQPAREAVGRLRHLSKQRALLCKMARWDPDKRWLLTIQTVAELKRQKLKPLLIARGGVEPHGEEVLRAAAEHGLQVEERELRAGAQEIVGAVSNVNDADIVSLRSHVDAASRRVLFRGVDAVLANSGHEPFGLVGLETMAVGGVAATGMSGEDYVVPGQNALVLQTADPCEFVELFRHLRENPGEERALRNQAKATARRFAWPRIVNRVFLPHLGLLGRSQPSA